MEAQGASLTSAQWQNRNQSAQFTGLYPAHGKAKSAKEAFDLVMVNGPGAKSEGDVKRDGGATDRSMLKEEPNSDPEKDFPNATPDEIRHLRVLQEQKKGLLEQLRKQRTEKALVARQGLGAFYPKHDQEPLLVLDNNRWHVIGHSEEQTIQIECNNREEVLVHKCSGIDQQMRIKILGPCSHLHIEECHNVKFIVDALLFAGAVSDSSGIEMVLGAEVPNLLLRNVRGCDLTLCPENMDGGIETVNCSGVSVHSVFRGGFLALEPADLMRAPTKYVAQIPDRVYTIMQGHQVISESRGHRNLANASQVWWTQRSAELYGRGA